MQRWYCNCCGGRHKPWMGMILEIRQKDQVMYAKVPVKDLDAQHLHILILEANASEQDSRSPAALYKSLKRQTPKVGNHIRYALPQDFWHDPSEANEGVYKVDSGWYATLPVWSWIDLYIHGTAFRNAVIEE